MDTVAGMSLHFRTIAALEKSAKKCNRWIIGRCTPKTQRPIRQPLLWCRPLQQGFHLHKAGGCISRTLHQCHAMQLQQYVRVMSALPSEETSQNRESMSAKGQYATFANLFDHRVGADQNGIRDRQAQQLCRPGIDNQVMGGGLLDGNVAGSGTL